jgi:hypothetical protein
MKSLKILFVLCIMLGFAASANSLGNGKQVERPFRGTFYAVVAEEYPPYEILSLTGNATHLGNVKGSSMTFIRPPAPHYIEGDLWAANGDYIHFYGWPTMIVTDPPTLSGTMSGKFYISGGTGRFTGCHGEGEIEGTFSMTEDWAMWTVDGTITY